MADTTAVPAAEPAQRPVGVTGVRLGGAAADVLDTLGPLGDLPGRWSGYGFNAIWRPHFNAPGSAASDHFLQLNLTQETLQFTPISTSVPNRGGSEPDIFLAAVQYLQQISDANFPPPQGGGALHFEPGIWLSVPATKDTAGAPTVNRLGSIPHGSAILADGTAEVIGVPAIGPASITPFKIGDPAATINNFPEQTIGAGPLPFRNDPLPPGITQTLVSNPNSLLTEAIARLDAEGFHITSTTVLHVATQSSTGGPTGGIENIPFLNAVSSADIPGMSATFWIEKWTNLEGQTCLTLQYTQTVLMNFATLTWPHVTVGSLSKVF